MGLGGLMVILEEGCLVTGVKLGQADVRFNRVGEYHEVSDDGIIVVPINGEVDEGGIVQIRRIATHQFEAVPVASRPPAYCRASFEIDPQAMTP